MLGHSWTMLRNFRIEDTEKSLEAFELAARYFEETRKSLQKEVERIEDLGERQMVTRVWS